MSDECKPDLHKWVYRAGTGWVCDYCGIKAVG